MSATMKQHHDKDCFLCCLAMALGISYEEMEGRLGAEFVERIGREGLVGSRDLERAFGGLGLMRELHFKVLFVLPEYGTTGWTRNLLWGRRACIQVRSKNYADEMHIVYWDGEALHDPSNKRAYEWTEVEPIHIWLFAETARDDAA